MTTVFLILFILLLLILGGAYVCYRMAFFSPPRKGILSDADRFPPGKIYEPYHPRMRQWMDQVAAMSPEIFTVTSRDGLTLKGKYYELFSTQAKRYVEETATK